MQLLNDLEGSFASENKLKNEADGGDGAESRQATEMDRSWRCRHRGCFVEIRGWVYPSLRHLMKLNTCDSALNECSEALQ